ncbi:MAG: SurA N-terminal domain-containing protein [Deltaproteobacteria bacterium]|nr:SurA N-terminal domain-containing protein [Deltaproteobacteria bacterium]
MVLSLMRKHAGSLLIKAIMVVIALSFVIYFGSMKDSSRIVEYALVNDKMITKAEYDNAYRNLVATYQEQFGGMWNNNLAEMFDLENSALENLINTEIISQEAENLGLRVTEKEIQGSIVVSAAFQTEGRFDKNRYASLLSYNRMTPAEFEGNIRQDLLQKKINQFLMTLLPVTENEVMDQYKYSNEQVKVSFVKFQPDDFRETINKDSAGMEKYFEDNREEYRIPEKIKLLYIRFDPAEFREGIELEDQDIANYYEDNIQIFSQERQVKARHILFSLDLEAPEEVETVVKEQAQAVLERVKNGEDFSKLAQEFSQGPSKDDGGDLGYFSSGQMVKEFEDAAFSMKKDEISDLVRTSFGYHIIRVDDIKDASIKELEEVGSEIMEILINNESSDLAYDKGQTLVSQMPYHDVDLVQYAELHQVEVNETDYFALGDSVPDIGGDMNLCQSLFALDEKGVSELVEADEMFYIIQIADKEESYLPEMDTVLDALDIDYQDHLMALAAKSAAETYLASLKEGKDWDEFAKENGLEPEMTDFFPREGSVPLIGYAPELQEEAFKLSEEKRFPEEVFENRSYSYVIRWEDAQEIDLEKYKVEKDGFRNNLIMQKQQAVFTDWLESLKRNADIKRLKTF